MNSTLTLYLLLRAAPVACFLGIGTTLLLFMERKVTARAQHRPGPNHAGAFGQWQVGADLLKVFLKSRDAKTSRGSAWLLYTALPLQLILPLVFMAILLGAWQLGWASHMGLLVLFLLVALSVVLEALFLREDSSPIEKYEYRRYVGVNVIGLCGLLLSIGTVVLHTGSLALHDIEAIQEGFPFHAIFLSPGLFLAAIVSLLSFFFILAVSPVGEMGNKGILGRGQYLYFLYKRTWLFVLASFWVYLFAGAFGDLWSFPIFCIHLAVLLAALVVLQSSLPRLRAGDAMEIGMRFLLPCSLCSLLLEVLWTGWWTR